MDDDPFAGVCALEAGDVGPTALRRTVCDPATMREQIDHLIEMSRPAHVNVQVLPFSAGGHLALGGPITIVRFAEHDLDDVVYLEQLISARYPEGPEADRYQKVMDALAIRASQPATTTTFLKNLLKDL